MALSGEAVRRMNFPPLLFEKLRHAFIFCHLQRGFYSIFIFSVISSVGSTSDRLCRLHLLQYSCLRSFDTMKEIGAASKTSAVLIPHEPATLPDMGSQIRNLKIERDAGRVFKGWNEGKIYFAPTYKYSYNSDSYIGEVVQSNIKRRTPAWCDHILWHGDRIVQLSYIRGESIFSDYRPICAIFKVEVGVLNDGTRKGFFNSQHENQS